MLKQHEAGFTLVEITIVLAVTASLATIVLSGQSSARASAQFRSVIESFGSSLDSIRSDSAASIVNNSPGNDISQVIFGELVEVRPGDTYVTVSDLTATVDVIPNTLHGNLTRINTRKVNVSYGATIKSIASPSVMPPVTVTGDTYRLVYHRLLSSGKLVLYAVGRRLDYLDFSNYTESPGLVLSSPFFAIEATTITLTDPSGRTGSVTVDGQNDAATTTQAIIQ